MKKKPAKKFPHYLHHLVMFLNSDLKPPLTNLFGDLADSLGTVKTLQAELRDDVEKLLNPPPIPTDATFHSYSSTAAEYWLRIVADKIAEMDFIPSRHIERWPNPLLKNYRNPLRIGDEQFVVLDEPNMDGTRAYAYWYLDRTLRSGDFSMLRRCRSCSRYFFTQRTKKQCCSRYCNTAYQNSYRLNSGYFNDLRKKKKERERKRILRSV